MPHNLTTSLLLCYVHDILACRGLEDETALHLAASCGCIEIVSHLLKHGEFVDTEVSPHTIYRVHHPAKVLIRNRVNVSRC